MLMSRQNALIHKGMVPETGIEPVRPLSGKRRILSPLCLPISPLGLSEDEILAWRYMASREFDEC
jgi:hypothetical protein